MSPARTWSLGALAALVIFVVLVYLLFVPLLPVWIGLSLAYALNPLVDRLAARGWPRWAAATVVLVVATLLLAGVLAWIGPLFISQLGDFAANLPHYIGRGIDRLADFAGRLGMPVPAERQRLETIVQTRTHAAFESAVNHASELLGKVAGGVETVFELLVAFFLVPLFFFYGMRDLPKVYDTIVGLVPPARRPAVTRRLRRIDGVLSGFIRGQLVLAAIMAVLFSVVLEIVGVPYAIVIGLFSGALDLVPFFGHITAYLVSMGVTLGNYSGASKPIELSVAFALTTWAEGHLLSPPIVGRRTGLSAPEAIVAILVFGWLFGFVGLLIGMPLAGVLKVLLKDLAAAWRRSPAYAEPKLDAAP